MRVQTTDSKQAQQVAKAIGVDYVEGMVFTITSPKNVVGRECECGCGGKTSGGKWMPGHDATHKSRLYGLARGTDETQRDLALAELKDRGWPLPSAKKTAPAPLPLPTPAS